MALYFVCNTAAQHLKVVLSGEGADEIFGGYNIYKEPLEMQWYDKIPLPHPQAYRQDRRGAARPPGPQLPGAPGQAAGRAVHRQRLHVHPEGAPGHFEASGRGPAPEDLCKPYYDMVADKDPVTKMQFVDLNMWMVGDILLKADKMSMANSLELRVPFLDKKIMALAGRIP